ncbi:MAG: response regulator [Pseudomonadota bacterium]
MSLKEIIKIMVVDDMSVSRGLIIQPLESAGVTNITYMKDGKSAFDKLVASPVHLVISDYNMPGMDGLELLKAMRSNPQTQKVGFILISGSEDADVVKKGRELGMNNYLKKPFSDQSLLDCITAVVGPL